MSDPEWARRDYPRQASWTKPMDIELRPRPAEGPPSPLTAERVKKKFTGITLEVKTTAGRARRAYIWMIGGLVIFGAISRDRGTAIVTRCLKNAITIQVKTGKPQCLTKRNPIP